MADTVQTVKVGDITVRVHRPALTDETRAKRENELSRALTHFARYLADHEKEKKQ